MNKKSIKNKSDNSKYIGNYQIIKKIGEGSYAKKSLEFKNILKFS